MSAWNAGDGINYGIVSGINDRDGFTVLVGHVDGSVVRTYNYSIRDSANIYRAADDGLGSTVDDRYRV